MDTKNFLKVENTDRIYHNTASNTDPITCAYCGSRGYIQSVSHTNCFKSYCTPPRSKQPPDVCEDGFSLYEPVFSSPPLHQPVFHNRLVPPNVFYINLNPNQCFEYQMQSNENFQNPKHPFFFMSHHGDNFEVNNHESKDHDKLPKHEGDGPNKTQANAFPFPFLCGCGNLVPLSYNTFTVPIVSYLVSWNSHITDKKLSSTNINSSAKKDSPKVSENQRATKICDSFFEKNNENFVANDVKNRDIWSPQEVHKNESKIAKEPNGSSTSFVSIASLDVEDELLNEKKKNNVEISNNDLMFNRIIENIKVEKKKYKDLEEEEETSNKFQVKSFDECENEKEPESNIIDPVIKSSFDSLNISAFSVAMKKTFIPNMEYSESESEDSNESSKKVKGISMQDDMQHLDGLQEPESKEVDEVKAQIEKKLEAVITTIAAGDLAKSLSEPKIDHYDGVHSESEDLNLLQTSTKDLENVKFSEKTLAFPFTKDENDSKVKNESDNVITKAKITKLPIIGKQKILNTTTKLKDMEGNADKKIQTTFKPKHYCFTPQNFPDSVNNSYKTRKLKPRIAATNRGCENLQAKSAIPNLKNLVVCKKESDKSIKHDPNILGDNKNKSNSKLKK